MINPIAGKINDYCLVGNYILSVFDKCEARYKRQ